ncbi:hypothetical protein KHQ81_07685 [Mycoplasmatota bacterium]|nr:hypothetical protein KHQ81_07685 [Mycoplasmatota bacterium]
MYPQQPYVEPSMYGRPPQIEGMYPQQQGAFPGMGPSPQQGAFPGMGPSPQQGPFPGMGPSPQQGPFYPQQLPYPQPSAPKPPKAPGTIIGDTSYNINARLDRIEREIIEMNRRLNNLTRRVRRIENFLNIRED